MTAARREDPVTNCAHDGEPIDAAALLVWMIYSVGTRLEDGAGGMCTVFAAFKESARLQARGIQFVDSHTRSHRLRSFCNAWQTLDRQLRPGDIAWLHCSYWLSISRKLLLGKLARRKGARVVVQLHGREVELLLNNKPGTWLVHALLKMADGVVVMTPWWQRYFTARFDHIAPKLHVCPNPIGSHLREVAAQPHSPRQSSQEVRVLAMSRLVPGKGFEQALAAMTALPETYHLTIAGDGVLMARLKQQARELGLEDRVSFPGWIEEAQKHRVLNGHQVFLLPSRNDAFGMGFVEAMAYGLPVVALNYQATPDVVINGRTGVLCDDHQPQTLAKAVESCAENAQVMGPAAKRHVLSAFDNDAITANLLRFFDQL